MYCVFNFKGTLTKDEEVEGAGVVVKSEERGFENFHIPMCQLSDRVNLWLKPSAARAKCEDVAKSLIQGYTWEKTAKEIVRLFEGGHQRSINAANREKALLSSVFCRRYDPGTGTPVSGVYRLGTNRYEPLETALVEILSERHTPTEVEWIFKHFQGRAPLLQRNDSPCKWYSQLPRVWNSIPPVQSPGRKESTRDENKPSR